MKRKPLPKAITRSIANLQEIAAGFVTDEQGRVPRQPMTRQSTTRQPMTRDATPFDAVEPEPRMETPAATSEAVVQPANRNTADPQPRDADPLAARRRALARRDRRAS